MRYEKQFKAAVKEGNLALVKNFVEKGADIHAMDDEPLRLASEYEHLELVKYLVEKGANMRNDNDIPY